MNKISSFTYTILGFFLLLTSCNDDPYKMGLDLMSSGDNLAIKVDSTIQNTSGTITFDSLVTHELYFSNGLYYEIDSSLVLGDYNDVIFGKKTSHLLYQFYPTFADSIPADYGADSLVLYLQIDSVLLGNRNEKQEYEIYALKKTLSAEPIYYSNTDYSAYKGDFISSGTYTPNTRLIRISLTNTPLLDTLFHLDSIQNLGSNFNRGFYIVSKSTPGKNGVLLNIKTINDPYSKRYSLSNLSLYYKTYIVHSKGTVLNGDTLQNDSTVLESKYRTYRASRLLNGASSIVNDFTNSQAATNPDYFYIQGVAGAFGHINLLNLYDTWKNYGNENSGYLAFSKVELELTPAYSYLNSIGITPKDYPSSLRLFYQKRIHHDKSEFGLDTSITYSYSILGMYDRLEKKYRFNMTPLLQKIVKEKPENTEAIKVWNNFDLYLKDNNGIHSGGRVAFRKDNFLRYKVIYSIIK